LKLTIVFATVLIVAITIPSAFADSISVDIDNTSYDINYIGNNVVLKSAIADLDFISLIFETEVSGSGGDVSITFQRDFFDAKIGTNIDDEFFILSDGDEIEFEETKNDESRTLSFSLSAGTEEIEIIGTILANNSFLIEQQQKEANIQAESDAKAQAESDAKAQAESDAKAQAESDAKAQAESDAKLNEERKLEKLMNSCGDGTIFENGECVLSPMEKNAKDTNIGPLIYSVVIGLMIGIVIILILWGIGKKSHKVLSDDDS
jgi:chemotaxis protein histidine kinase CheA|tara:strand:+ start:206 stop:994 length:789 start_codon:yes stop_codon:yes gene_type:complete